MISWEYRRRLHGRRNTLTELDSELIRFYERHGFGPTPGARPKFVGVYTGCALVPMPNIETRRRFLEQHDLHHLTTGYSVGRIGEGEVSAWELASGSMRVSPVLGLMNLIALSTGWFVDRRRMWDAYRRGLESRNLYSADMRRRLAAGEWRTLDDLRGELLNVRRIETPSPLDRLRYAMYVTLSVMVHVPLVIPAVVARFAADLRSGKGILAGLKPVRRSDLY